jgi:hypothetical protein
MKQIADLTLPDIIARKKSARRDRARLSFGEKVLIVEKMREGFAPFKARRLKRQQHRTYRGA